MCPVCLATVAWMAAGVVSTGGLTALVLNITTLSIDIVF